MLELHELINSELSRVHRLEDQISLKVYGTKLKTPVSVLEDDEVMKAVQDPSKLAGDTRDKIMVMKEVLDLMKSAKQHHQQVLQQLASPVTADEQVDPIHEEEEMPRRSSRDKQPKRNSDFFTTDGLIYLLIFFCMIFLPFCFILNHTKHLAGFICLFYIFSLTHLLPSIQHC